MTVLSAALPVAAVFADSPYGNSLGPGAGIMAAFFGIWGIVCLAVFVIMLIAYWKIVERAGYSGALSLLVLVPIVNVIMLLVFAFSEWPVQQQLRLARGVTQTNLPR
ncbi:MAG TPA: hypothetical protein VEJ20_05910 [Candidatus Eremiobacteraceae bacterium]|nr:hypothetical protein [Candidatus Eremiobacteraceae bacterium]